MDTSERKQKEAQLEGAKKKMEKYAGHKSYYEQKVKELMMKIS